MLPKKEEAINAYWNLWFLIAIRRIHMKFFYYISSIPNREFRLFFQQGSMIFFVLFWFFNQSPSHHVKKKRKPFNRIKNKKIDHCHQNDRFHLNKLNNLSRTRIQIIYVHLRCFTDMDRWCWKSLTFRGFRFISLA